MTRFYKEINGLLGEYWKKSAEKEVAEAVKMADANATVTKDGAISWKTNGRYLMDDLCEKLEYAGYNFSRKATAEKRKEQVARDLEVYKADVRWTEENIAEMRSTFGEGTTVVDLFTGRRIRL